MTDSPCARSRTMSTICLQHPSTPNLRSIPPLPLALTMGLLQIFTDALGNQAQARLDAFTNRATERSLFIT